MRPYEELTDRGRARRLRRLATLALASYDVDVVSLELVGLFTNVMFRVRSRSGASYILRICRPGWRTETDTRSEIAWLRALTRETDITVPEPIQPRDGTDIVQAGAPGVPEYRRCVLMTWLPGPLLGRRLNGSNLRQMGALFAHLHRHASGFVPGAGFTQRKMDTIYARGEEDILFNSSCTPAFTPRSRRIYETTLAQVQQTLDRLYAVPGGLRVIHHDLHHDNIKVHRGRLCPLDFEDTVWGYPEQDIAMALQDLMMDVDRVEFEPLQSAFRAGYEAVSPWPASGPATIDTLRAGRMIWVTNYVARYERQYLEKHIGRIAPIFDAFLESGRLRRP